MWDASREKFLISTHPPVAEVVLVLHVAIVGEQEVDPCNIKLLINCDDDHVDEDDDKHVDLKDGVVDVYERSPGL